MKRSMIIGGLLIVLLAGAGVQSQETYFGKNKVRYKDFDWSYIQTRRFDIYFYEDAYPLAKFAATVLESSYVEISRELDYRIQRRVPVFVYNSHGDFIQTNITPTLISESVGGFTEAFKNRIVIPFSGSYEEFRHVLHHELTHAVVYDLVYGNFFSSLLTRHRLFNVPLWFAEGYAEYSSRHGWDYFTDMFVRDATLNNYLAPPQYLGGFLAYKQGQAMVKYIAETYGEDKLGEILRKGKVHLSMGRAMKEALGVTQKKFWEDFHKEMKRRYWPDIAERKEADEISKRLTKAREDGSFFNEKPAFSPDGSNIAIFTDRSDYTEIVLISAKDGKMAKRLVKAERSSDLESLHSFVSGMAFAPDGRKLAFVAKSSGTDAIMLYDLDRGKIYLKKRYKFQNILSPSWSPDGKLIAFSALKGVQRDIYVWNLETDETTRITDGIFDDVEPSWLAESDGIIFSSDRHHPDNPERNGKDHMYVEAGAFLPGDFKYGVYNLFRVDLVSKEVSPLSVGPGQNKVPKVSPDGKKVAFISNRNGIDNIYVAYLDSDRRYAVTDILTGVRSISWSPDGKKIAFSAFFRGGFDIFVMEDLVPAGEDGVLATTDFLRGEYDILKTDTSTSVFATHRELEPSDYETFDVDPNSLAAIPDTSTSADSSVTSDSNDSGEVATTDSTKLIETGIYGDEYVFVSEESGDPLDSLLIDVSSKEGGLVGRPLQEPVSFDSILPPTESGDYKINPYKVRFTPDYIGGGFAYDTFFGLRGQSFFLLSDYLGNHQFFIAADLVNSIDQSNVQFYYFYNRKRTSVGAGLFHTKNFYLDPNRFLFSDRFYGAKFFASRPFSTFSRLEFNASQSFIDREYLEFDDPRSDRSTKATTAELSYVVDNILWGITGPVNGRRAKLTVGGGVNLFNTREFSFTSAEFDYRRYWHFSKTYSFAIRFAGGASFGGTPKRYFLGGTTNYIGNRTVNAEVFEVENLYFADVVTPLRGLEYYELEGNRFGLVNMEFRFPMIDYFAMRFPLPIVLSRVGGVFFIDMGAAWTGSEFKGGTSDGDRSRLQDIKTGFGIGMRANLGFAVLRYDIAWSTDFDAVSDRARHFFSFGADF